MKEKRVFAHEVIRELKAYLALSRYGNYEYIGEMSHVVEARGFKNLAKCRILSILIFLMASCHTFQAAASAVASHVPLVVRVPFATYCKSITSGELRVVKFIALSTVKCAQNAYTRDICVSRSAFLCSHAL